MTEHQTIETQLFDWENWDQLDVNDLCFYDVTFKTDVGPFKAGDTADEVVLLLSQSKIEVYVGDNVAYTGQLTLGVKDLKGD
jgi:hypothetical protein